MNLRKEDNKNEQIYKNIDWVFIEPDDKNT